MVSVLKRIMRGVWKFGEGDRNYLKKFVVIELDL